MNKLQKVFSGVAGVVGGLFATAFAHAQAIPAGSLGIPTSTQPALLASIGNLFNDPGMLAVVVLAIALPLFFWFIGRVKRIAPGGGR